MTAPKLPPALAEVARTIRSRSQAKRLAVQAGDQDAPKPGVPARSARAEVGVASSAASDPGLSARLDRLQEAANRRVAACAVARVPESLRPSAGLLRRLLAFAGLCSTPSASAALPRAKGRNGRRSP
jgi:hypothetical protein